MSHTLLTLALAAFAWLVGLHVEIAIVTASFYCGREHAQAEYRVIKSFYGGLRANAPLWCGFECRAWNFKSLTDWMGPVVAVVAVMVI